MDWSYVVELTVSVLIFAPGLILLFVLLFIQPLTVTEPEGEAQAAPEGNELDPDTAIMTARR